jgi:hypothetical protein
MPSLGQREAERQFQRALQPQFPRQQERSHGESRAPIPSCHRHPAYSSLRARHPAQPSLPTTVLCPQSFGPAYSPRSSSGPPPAGAIVRCYTAPMSVSTETSRALRAAEVLLNSAPQGQLDLLAVEKRIGKALRLLAQEEPQWIDLPQATRLLGVLSDETPRALVRLGLLRSRSCGDGQLQVRLDDVLNRRWEAEDLLGIGGEELTPEELRIMKEERPGTNPWEREQIKSSRRTSPRVITECSPGATAQSPAPLAFGRRYSPGW